MFGWFGSSKTESSGKPEGDQEEHNVSVAGMVPLGPRARQGGLRGVSVSVELLLLAQG